jgi:hypothetical protein
MFKALSCSSSLMRILPGALTSLLFFILERTTESWRVETACRSYFAGFSKNTFLARIPASLAHSATVKFGLFCATLILVALSRTGAAQQAVLQGIILDGTTGLQSPASVAIVDSNGNKVIENDSYKAGFRCLGEFTKQLPPGRTRVRVTRGFETRFEEKELQLEPGSRTEITFTLRRSLDLRNRGWYAGDSHVHMLHGERTVPVSFDFVALTARTEDLQYLSLAQAWEIEHPTPESLEAQLRPRSVPDCFLTWNLEAPKNYYKGDAGRCLGHCWNLGVRGRTTEGANVVQTLLDASMWDYESEKPSYANFESHRLIHEQGGAVFYTHPARWWMGPWGGKGGYPKVDQMRVSNMAVELPLDTMLGPTFDGLDVITGPGEFENNEKAFQLWASLLNHGYRLAATGSSDACFDRPGGGTPGVPRTYTFIPGRFSLSKITEATAAGHTFVTTGPLLIATLDGKPPGSVFRAAKKGHILSIESWASGESTQGLSQLEVLRNGESYKLFTFSNEPANFETNLVLHETEPSWYCLRLRQSGIKPRMAISGAFYFDDGEYRRPEPVAAQVHARIADAETDAALSGSLTEVAYSGTLTRDLKQHVFTNGEEKLVVPGTLRLRAEAQGYEPVVLSPVLDNPELMTLITQLSDADLLDWKTFERIREQFSNVVLVFKLHKAR